MYYYEPPAHKRWLGPGNLKKFLVCIVIIILVLLIKRINLPFSQAVLGKINFYISEYNYEYNDIQEVVKKIPKIQEALPVFSQTRKDTMLMPVTGKIVSEYGMRMHPILKVERMHSGIDIEEKEGTPVRAALDGIVLSVEQNKELGNVVKLDHGNSLITVYAHLKDVYVKKGEQITKGSILGTVGKTGLTQAPHLHFEVLLENKPVNPELWLNLKKS